MKIYSLDPETPFFYLLIIYLWGITSTINSQWYIIGFIGGHFENMQINPVPGIRFMETFSGTHHDLLNHLKQ